MPNKYDPRETVMMQIGYHVEALGDGSLGGAERKKGDLFPATQLSRQVFHVLVKQPNMETSYAKLHAGPVPVPVYAPEPEVVVAFDEEGAPVTYNQLLDQARQENDGSTEETKLELSVVEQANLGAQEQNLSETFVQPDENNRKLDARETVRRYEELNSGTVDRVSPAEDMAQPVAQPTRKAKKSEVQPESADVREGK